MELSRRSFIAALSCLPFVGKFLEPNYGDGLTDATAYIQGIVNRGGGHLSAGTYLTSKPIVFNTPHVTLIGAGDQTKIICTSDVAAFVIVMDVMDDSWPHNAITGPQHMYVDCTSNNACGFKNTGLTQREPVFPLSSPS